MPFNDKTVITGSIAACQIIVSLRLCICCWRYIPPVCVCVCLVVVVVVVELLEYVAIYKVINVEFIRNTCSKNRGQLLDVLA